MREEQFIARLDKQEFKSISETEFAKKYKIKDEELRNIQGKKKIREVFLTVIYELKTSGLDKTVSVYYVTDDGTKVKRYKGKLSEMGLDHTGAFTGLKLLE